MTGATQVMNGLASRDANCIALSWSMKAEKKMMAYNTERRKRYFFAMQMYQFYISLLVEKEQEELFGISGNSEWIFFGRLKRIR